MKLDDSLSSVRVTVSVADSCEMNDKQSGDASRKRDGFNVHDLGCSF